MSLPINDFSVAIIMPCFNSHATILQSVNSIINQTFTNWKLYIIDDGSTDNTLELLEDLKKDNRIVVFSKASNQGVDKARRKAFDIMNPCSYVAFCDSDDIWLPNKLEKQLQFMLANKCDISCTSAIFIDENYNELRIKVIPPKSFGYKKVLYSNPIINSSAILSYDIAKSVDYPIDGGTEDYEYWLSILRTKHIQVYGMDDVLCKYMIRSKSVSRNKLKAVKRNWFVYRHYEGIGVLKSIYLIMQYSVIKIFKLKEIKY